jgi:hypothetical protein
MNGDRHLTQGLHIFGNTELSFFRRILSMGDRVKCLRRPWVVPIYGAAVDN